METIKNPVIVWSIDDFNTLGLMRELGQSGLDLVFLIKGKAGYASKSKYCVNYVETESIQTGYEYLMATYKSADFKPVLIVASDEIITFVDQHRKEMEPLFILPGTKEQGNIEKYIDKNTMTALAEDIGILCPQSKEVRWDSSIQGVKYPCLIKPSHQTEGHYNEFKFMICQNEKELKQTLRFVRHESVFILQQYIPKEKDLLVYGGRLYDGKTVIAGAMIRDRWADSGSSSHGYITCDVPECADTGKIAEFLEKIDYYGLFSFEYGMIGDKAYFFEVNLRNDGTSHYFFQAGANIPLAYVYSCVGRDYSAIPVKISKEAWFIDEVFDVENVIKGVISKEQWKKEMAEATIFKYYDREDQEPWKTVKKTRVKQIAQDFLLKKYRLYIVALLDKLGLRK